MEFETLTDEEWAMVAPLFSDTLPVRLSQRGRPRAEPREVANAVLWVIATGRPWTRLPQGSPSIPTCRGRYEEWRASGSLDQAIKLLTHAGRKFPKRISQSGRAAPVAARDPAGPDSVRLAAAPQVFWSNPDSWRAPSPAPASHTGAPQRHTAAPRRTEHASGPLWMGLASHGTSVTDERGYVIYTAADLIGGRMYRAWAEIMKHGKRVARSGLIGQPFTDLAAAQQYALEWAQQWIEDDSGKSTPSRFEEEARLGVR
ncbi:transposase [Trinickia terrae]|uniref:Transposase n=1 Tax=Trinickia terrae TaxID=2571161 RepID=A0A4U1HB99_9BURK|nr:transposase [Trinickia terrae]TKC78075.1 transposase [Trinickia terrae]